MRGSGAGRCGWQSGPVRCPRRRRKTLASPPQINSGCERARLSGIAGGLEGCEMGQHHKILIVDDHPITQSGLRLLLAGQDRYEVVGEIGRAHAALQSLMRSSYAVFCLKKTTQ